MRLLTRFNVAPSDDPLSCLATLRSAISQYYADNGFKYPDNLSVQLVPKYIHAILILWKGFKEDGATPSPAYK